jgi:pyruvate formate lyase activating enzyme
VGGSCLVAALGRCSRAPAPVVQAVPSGPWDPTRQFGTFQPLRQLDRRPARWAETQADGRVKCLLCPKLCVLEPGRRGPCLSRLNEGGTLQSLLHGRTWGLTPAFDTNEIPIFLQLFSDTLLNHATCGCNLSCEFCVSPEVAQTKPEDAPSCPATARQILDAARAAGIGTLHFTDNEPLVGFEELVDLLRLTSAEGLRSFVATNGFVSPEPMAELLPLVDHVNVGLKSFDRAFYTRYCGAELDPILKTIATLGATSDKLSVSYLLIPGRSDAPEMLASLRGWLKQNVGVHVPVMFFAFMPAHHWMDVPATPAESLAAARKAFVDDGFRYVLVHDYFHPEICDMVIHCHRCRGILLQRNADHHVTRNLDGLRCRSCGAPVLGARDA